MKGVGFVEVASRHATTEERRWRHDARSPRPTLLVLAINSRHVFTRLLNFWYYSLVLESALPTILLAYQMVDSNSLFFWFCAPLDYSLSLSLSFSLLACECSTENSLSLSLEKNEGDEEKISLENFSVPFFWIRDFLDWDSCSLQVCWRKWIDCIHVWLTCARLCCWYKHLRKTGQASSFLSFLDPWQLSSFSYTRWSGLTASQCLLCFHFFFYQRLGP